MKTIAWQTAIKKVEVDSAFQVGYLIKQDVLRLLKVKYAYVRILTYYQEAKDVKEANK